MTNRIKWIGACVFGLFVCAACAGIEPPTPKEILSNPLGKGPLQIGMSKDEVSEIWGEADLVQSKGNDPWGAVKEIWIYEARYPNVVPFDVGFASKTKYLEFTGDSLVSFHD